MIYCLQTIHEPACLILTLFKIFSTFIVGSIHILNLQSQPPEMVEVNPLKSVDSETNAKYIDFQYVFIYKNKCVNLSKSHIA